MNDVTTKAPRLTEAQKRSVVCPRCGAPADEACRGSRTPGANTLGGGWGGPPSLDRAHDERRTEALRALPAAALRVTAKVKLVTVTVKFAHDGAENSALLGRVFTLAPRVETGLVPCTGEAHSNAFIDNCGVCAPRWGEVMSYAPLTPTACQEGFAVPYSAGDREAFDEAQKAGAVVLVTVTTKSSSFSAWVATGCVKHTDCAATPTLGRACSEDATWPRRCSKCGHSHTKAENAKHSAAGFFCTWCGDNAPALKGEGSSARACTCRQYTGTIAGEPVPCLIHDATAVTS